MKKIIPELSPKQLNWALLALLSCSVMRYHWYACTVNSRYLASIISNNHLSRRENLVLVLTLKSKIRLQNIVEKRRNCSFFTIFSIYISN